MQKLLVTGANGFVASALIPMLLPQYEVIATGAGPSRLPFDLPYLDIDFTRKDAVMKAMATVKPDILIHTAALSKPDECELNREKAYQVNVEGTAHWLEAAGECNSFFLFLSTDFVFSGDRGMYREEDERAPVNYYGETKLMAEDLVMQYPAAWSIARTVLVYGPSVGPRLNLVTQVAQALKQQKPLRIFKDQVRTPTYVEDLAKGLVSITDRKAEGIFHLSGAEVMSPYEMAIATAALLGYDPTVIEAITEADMQQPARRPLKTGFVLNKAQQLLNYAPRSFEEGLRKTFGKENAPL